MNIPEYEDAIFMLAAAMSGHPYTHNLDIGNEYGFGDIEIDKKVAIKSMIMLLELENGKVRYQII